MLKVGLDAKIILKGNNLVYKEVKRDHLIIPFLT